ncbi:MAG: heparinase II/III-family protein [Thermoguttaceae bacterium]|nr:heparinase II/III-family protein [Thermoguttaceae bacterium]MDW8078475.1 heparinase II/III family protein [Thermoguttaceae bacterium]
MVRQMIRPVLAALLLLTLLVLTKPSVGAARAETVGSATFKKVSSTFYPAQFRQQILAAVSRDPWAGQRAKQIVAEAEFWFQMSPAELWGLMFGPTLPRSWHVYSSGFCPACKKSVPMYTWKIDAKREPWKVRCPHCQMRFPTNDFAAYYRSGLDERGIFDPARADRSLLFNVAHPEPNDPLRSFGVDDGSGYREGEHCWRFVGAYLIYGQWKQLVLGGIRALAAAYLVTGDPAYARKAGVMLDRVADLQPSFDFRTQAFIYDVPSYADGYVTVWHDACEEVRLLALCYDGIFEAIRDDPEFAGILREQASRYKVDRRKDTIADIQANLEHGLIHDPLAQVRKITSNFPRTPFTQATLYAVLGDEASRRRSMEILEATLAQATAVDGVTGEKGLSGYAAFATQGIANWLELFDRLEKGCLEQLAQKFPLRDTFRFHIDTWALEQYYPRSGDAGAFAHKESSYVGLNLSGGAYSFPSTLDGALPVGTGWKLLWRLYEITGDVDFVRLIYRENGRRTEGLPYDLTEDNPKDFQAQVAKVIKEHGESFELKSVNKQKWAIALLRSGQGNSARTVWLDYDSGGGHGHADGMTLGLFAWGLDLLPDFGYPPVQYGGWGSPRARWYVSTVAHNTVVVDGQDQRRAQGKTVLWGQAGWAQAIRASCPALTGGNQFDRTVALVDHGPESFYVLDIFRVEGGRRHDKFIHPHFSQLEPDRRLPSPEGLDDSETGYSGRAHVQLTRWRRLASPQTVANIRPDSLVFTWKIEDRLRYLPAGTEVSLRCFDATPEAEILSADAWIVPGFSSTDEAYIPALIIRRHAPPDQSQLKSTFITVLSAFTGKDCPLSGVRTVDLSSLGTAETKLQLSKELVDKLALLSADVLIEVMFTDGVRDLVVAWNGSASEGTTTSASTPESGPPGLAILRFHPAKPNQPEIVVFPLIIQSIK